jgi:hypothetical protein
MEHARHDQHALRIKLDKRRQENKKIRSTKRERKEEIMQRNELKAVSDS